ncbi:MAG: hypothetical protein O2788_05715 [Chloroflexi bacterium]|nr:hypothetical protein [Chloroflexota bacterium]
MFRDEGTEPSIEFKRRMRESVERTPTSLFVVLLLVLLVARLVIIAHHRYIAARCRVLSRRIEASTDLRSLSVRGIRAQSAHAELFAPALNSTPIDRIAG